MTAARASKSFLARGMATYKDSKTDTHTATRRGMTAREAWLAWAACAAVSAALVLLCSSTSPLFSIMSDDSSIFLVVGKHWPEGWLPYRGLWDSKGLPSFW